MNKEKMLAVIKMTFFVCDAKLFLCQYFIHMILIHQTQCQAAVLFIDVVCCDEMLVHELLILFCTGS